MSGKRLKVLSAIGVLLVAAVTATWWWNRQASGPGGAGTSAYELLPADATLVIAGRPDELLTEAALARLRDATARAGHGMAELTSDAVWRETESVAIGALPGNDAVVVFVTRGPAEPILAARAQAFGFQKADVAGRPGWRRTFMAGVTLDERRFAVGTIRGVRAALEVHAKTAPSTVAEGVGRTLSKIDAAAPLVVATGERPELGLREAVVSVRFKPAFELRAWGVGEDLEGRVRAGIEDAKRLAGAIADAAQPGLADEAAELPGGQLPPEVRRALAALIRDVAANAVVTQHEGGVLVTAKADVDAQVLVSGGAELLAVWFEGRVAEANEAAVRRQLAAFAAALEMVRRRNGTLPADLATLTASEPVGPLQDAWQEPLVYTLTEGPPGYTLCSKGADRKVGTPDDLCAAEVAPPPPPEAPLEEQDFSEPE